MHIKRKSGLPKFLVPQIKIPRPARIAYTCPWASSPHSLPSTHNWERNNQDTCNPHKWTWCLWTSGQLHLMVLASSMATASSQIVEDNVTGSHGNPIPVSPVPFLPLLKRATWVLSFAEILEICWPLVHTFWALTKPPVLKVLLTPLHSSTCCLKTKWEHYFQLCFNLCFARIVHP